MKYFLFVSLNTLACTISCQLTQILFSRKPPRLQSMAILAGFPVVAWMRNRYNRLLTSDIEQSIKTKAVSSLYTVEAVTLPVATPSLWSVLKRLRDLAQRRAAERCELCRDLDMRGAMASSSLVEGLWKFGNATARDRYRAMRATGLEDRSGVGELTKYGRGSLPRRLVAR